VNVLQVIPFLVDVSFHPTHWVKIEEIFQEKSRRRESRDDSFGEMQAKYAKEAQEEATKVGEGLFAGVQCKHPFDCLHSSLSRPLAIAVVILSWYYFYHAR
jgi:hypothetical protein